MEQIAVRPSEFKALANEKIIKNILILFVNNQIGKLPDDAGRACVQQSPSPVFFSFFPFPVHSFLFVIMSARGEEEEEEEEEEGRWIGLNFHFF